MTAAITSATNAATFAVEPYGRYRATIGDESIDVEPDVDDALATLLDALLSEVPA